MANPTFARKWIFLSAATLITAVAITGGVLSAQRQRHNQKAQKRVLTLPPVISHVPKLRIANISVKYPGTEEAIAVVEILNTSHLAVMSVEISTKNKGDSGGVNEDGLMDPNNPRVVIPPFGTTTLHMSFGEMIPDAPLVISAAEFADGTAEGDKWSLNGMRAVRKHRQDLQRAEKKPKEGAH